MTRSGKTVPCEVVAVAVGVHPEIGFLRNSGIDVNDGILVNQQMGITPRAMSRISMIRSRASGTAPSTGTTPSSRDASRPGICSASGSPGARCRIFTHVFDLTFNVVGSTEQAGERVVRGSIKDELFSVLYLGNDRVRGGFLLEQSYVDARAAGALIANRSDIAGTKAKLSDPRFPLNRAAVQTVLILQGGGALGAFECGVVKALEERNNHPDLDAGVSIGAFNAAIIAANPGHAMVALQPSGAT